MKPLHVAVRGASSGIGREGRPSRPRRSTASTSRSSSAQRYGSAEGCVENAREACELEVEELIGPASVDGSMVFDETKLAECAARLRQLGSGAERCMKLPADLLSDCASQTFAGQLSEGAACGETTPSGRSSAARAFAGRAGACPTPLRGRRATRRRRSARARTVMSACASRRARSRGPARPSARSASPVARTRTRSTGRVDARRIDAARTGSARPRRKTRSARSRSR